MLLQAHCLLYTQSIPYISIIDQCYHIATDLYVYTESRCFRTQLYTFYMYTQQLWYTLLNLILYVEIKSELILTKSRSYYVVKVTFPRKAHHLCSNHVFLQVFDSVKMGQFWQLGFNKNASRCGHQHALHKNVILQLPVLLSYVRLDSLKIIIPSCLILDWIHKTFRNLIRCMICPYTCIVCCVPIVQLLHFHHQPVLKHCQSREPDHFFLQHWMYSITSMEKEESGKLTTVGLCIVTVSAIYLVQSIINQC